MFELNGLQLEILHLGNQEWSTQHLADFEELAQMGLIDFEEIFDDYGNFIRVIVFQDKVDEFFNQPSEKH